MFVEERIRVGVVRIGVVRVSQVLLEGIGKLMKVIGQTKVKTFYPISFLLPREKSFGFD